MDRSEQSQAFEAHWRSLCQGRSMPHTSDFDPLAIADLIPVLFELFVRDGETFSARIRFAGGDVRDTAKTEVTDTDFMSYVPDDRIDATRGRILGSYGQPCGLCQINPMSSGGGSLIQLELTGFPMASDDFDAVLFGTVVALEDDITDQSAIERLERARNIIWIDTGNGIPPSDFG